LEGSCQRVIFAFRQQVVAPTAHTFRVDTADLAHIAPRLSAQEHCAGMFLFGCSYHSTNSHQLSECLIDIMTQFSVNCNHPIVLFAPGTRSFPQVIIPLNLHCAKLFPTRTAVVTSCTSLWHKDGPGNAHRLDTF